MPENKHLKFFIIVAYVILGYLVLVKVFPEVIRVLLPFILAFIVATITNPFVRFMNTKCKFPRWLATAISLILVWILMTGVATAVVKKIVSELSNFFANLPDIITSISNTLKIIGLKWVSINESMSPEMSLYLNDFISNLTKDAISLITPLTKLTLSGATNIAVTLPSAFMFSVAFILASIFMTNDFEKVKRSLFNQIPKAAQDKVLLIKKYTFIAMGKYLKGMGIILCITFCELFVGFMILKVPYAFSIAILIALVDILPVFGTGTVLIPWAIISLLSGNFKFAIGITIIYITVTVIRQFIEPKVMSNSLGTYPLATLFAMYVGFKFFGVVGMIFGPILALILIYLQESGVIKFWKYDNNNIREKTTLENERQLHV